MVILSGSALSEEETPLELPKAEGSKSFDFEIDEINHEAIQQYQKGNFEKAMSYFKQALKLAQQLKDQSQGILHYNLALSLDKSGQPGEAVKEFYSARRFARGNPKILTSKRLQMYECGLNPSIPCKEKIPLEMNIEGSH